MPVNLSGVGLNQTFADNLSTKDRQDIKQFDSLEKAVNYANQHQGDEAVVKTKDETGKDTFAVISLKSGAKATDVFDPKSVNFGSSLITRDNKRIEVVDSPDEMNGAETTQSLVNIAVNDKANGLTKSQAYNNYDNRLPAYQANMVSLAGRVNDSETKLQVKLETLKKATPPNLIAISSIEQKLDELKTSKGILRAKMLILPKTAGDGDDGKGAKIPGTQIHIGDLRTKSLDAITPLRQRMTELQTQLIGEKNPSKIDSLKGQINLLQKEVDDVIKSNAQISEAQTKMVGRLGSLNTINSSINTARNALEGKTVKLQQLTEQFNNDPREATFKKDIQGKIDSLKSEINQTRTSLISQMNTQIVEFEKNSPKIGKELQAGPKAVISLLREEVTKLENVDVTKVEETVKSNNFLGIVKQAASKWDGISPQEGVMAGNIVENNAGFIKDYKTLQAGVKDLQADVDIAKKLPQFGFNKLVERNLLSAQGWTAGTTALTGVQANEAINAAYDNLDRQFSQYVGGSEHPAANWMTYGKYASREAGSQIQSLEASLESIKTLLKVDGSGENDKRALTALVKVMDTGPMTKQAMRMAAASMGVKDADKFTSPQLIEKMFDEIKRDPTTAPKKIEGVVNDLEGLHRALVKGNTEIYSNVVPAFNVYLDAESKGENGVEALKKAGYGKPSGATFVTPTDKDPQGFLVSAFSDYKGAKILDDKAKIADAKGPSHKAEATELRSQRDAMMHQANLKIGAQEQMSILQQPAIFGDPKVAGLLKAMNGTMTIKDKLLPDGSYRDNGLIPENKAGSDHGWAVFEARMGVREASTELEKKVAIKVKDENGITHLYVPTGTTDEMIKNHQLPKGGNGTISQYFADNLRDSEMTTNKPRGMTEIYTDNNQGQVTFEDRVFDGIGFATPPSIPTPSPATFDLVTTTVPYVTGKLYDELFK